MKLYPDKLAAHLAKGAAPIYLVHGDEPLQLGEVGDRLRAHARETGFDEREVIVANEDADWSTFRESADSLSLFAERRLIERLHATKEDIPSRGTVIDATETVERVVDEILTRCDLQLNPKRRPAR